MTQLLYFFTHNWILLKCFEPLRSTLHLITRCDLSQYFSCGEKYELIFWWRWFKAAFWDGTAGVSQNPSFSTQKFLWNFSNITIYNTWFTMEFSNALLSKNCVDKKHCIKHHDTLVWSPPSLCACVWECMNAKISEPIYAQNHFALCCRHKSTDANQ